MTKQFKVGIYAPSATLVTASITGGTVAGADVFLGTATYGSSATPFYANNSGSVSIGNKLTWNGSTLSIGDTSSGTVGLSAPANPSASNIAIYAGASAYSSASIAPFRVDYAGNLFSSSANLSGGSANFTNGASVSGNRITTIADKFTALTGVVTSSELINLVSDETGSGNIVFNTSPSFVTPNIGNATGSVSYASNSASLNNIAGSSYAQLSSANFTSASVGSNPIYTKSTAPYQPQTFFYTGSVAVYTSSSRFYNDTGGTRSIISVRASVGSAPTGSAMLIDVRKNGTSASNTIFTGSSISIPATSFTSGASTSFNSGSSLTTNDYLTVAISQVGSTAAGSDLTVQVNWS